MSSQRKIALSICKYLDSVDVSAKQEKLKGACALIAEAFDVSPEDWKNLPQNEDLVSLFASSGSASTATDTKYSTEDSEALKAEGNKAMSNKEYQTAIDKYTQALKIAPSNVVYLSNRSAAYSYLNEVDKAIKDAETATELDPTFARAYSRLGHALLLSEDYSRAKSVCEKGLALDPSNDTLKQQQQRAISKLAELESKGEMSKETPASGAQGARAGGFPDLSSLAGMMGNGAGGAGGAGGLAGLLNNPAIAGLYQNLMQNEKISQALQSGQMPNISELMSDPSIRNMASQFMNQQPKNDESSK